MFSAESIAPAPAPNGIAKTQKNKSDFERAKPKRAKAVKQVLIAVTSPVPNLFIRKALNKLATTVKKEINTVT